MEASTYVLGAVAYKCEITSMESLDDESRLERWMMIFFKNRIESEDTCE
jgi:hypothetical protein